MGLRHLTQTSEVSQYHILKNIMIEMTWERGWVEGGNKIKKQQTSFSDLFP